MVYRLLAYDHGFLSYHTYFVLCRFFILVLFLYVVCLCGRDNPDFGFAALLGPDADTFARPLLLYVLD